MGSKPVSFDQLTAAVENLTTRLETLELTVTNFVNYVSTQVPGKRDMDRIRQEIVLMKESGDYAGDQIGNINDADLRAMLELKPTLDNLLSIVNSFDDWKTTTAATIEQISGQLRALQLQLSAQERRIIALE